MHNRPSGISLLLIDDDAIAEDYFRTFVGDHSDVSVRYLADPTRAVETAVAVAASVLVVDLCMPVLDGFGVIEALRADPATAELPVILLSANDDADTKAEAFSRGASDYLVKWPDPRELLARLRYHTAAWHARRERDHAYNALRASQQELARTHAAHLQAQKMEAIGQLTGGVAHDFNNVLQIIGGNLQLLKMVGGVNEPGRARIDIALSGVERGARLASHLLAFARRQPLQSVVADVGAVLLDARNALDRTAGERVRVEMAIDPGLWPTTVDPLQLHNVLLSLCNNAREAMAGGGELTVNATNVERGSSLLGEVGDGDFVMIEVRDTGAGMAPEVLNRAFEPFFSTKPAGQAPGLGLSMAYGFVKQSGGEIVLRSEVGKGTSVRIFLRRATEAPSMERLPLAAVAEGGNETILVVEDEAEVRHTAVALLGTLGYQVLEAADAGAALDIVRSGAEIDLVFSDVLMPGEVSAADLAEAIKTELPGAPVLFTSGYAEGVISHGGQLDPSISLLQKPYQAEELAMRLRQLLQRRDNAEAA